MKKISQIIPMIMLIMIVLHTNHLFAPYRPGKTQTRQQQPQQQTQSQRAKGGGPAPLQTPTPKTDAQKKQEAADLEKKINQGTKQLADAVKNKQKAKTPEEEKLARKEILKKAKEVMTCITHHRHLQGEILGYSKEEIEGADAILADLEARRDALAKVINDFKKKQTALLVEGWKGRWLGSIKPGKETEYNNITKKINKLKPTLDELNTKVREQSIVAGAQKFTKTRAFAAASLATVLTTSGLYLFLGPVAIASEWNDFKNNPVEYSKQRLSQLKNLTSGWFSSAATKEAVTNAAGNALSETWTRYFLTNFTAGTLALANEALAITKDITKSVIVQATIAPAVMTLLATLRAQLEKLIEDPNATQEQIEQKSQEIITTAEKNGITIQKQK